MGNPSATEIGKKDRHTHRYNLEMRYPGEYWNIRRAERSVNLHRMDRRDVELTGTNANMKKSGQNICIGRTHVTSKCDENTTVNFRTQVAPGKVHTTQRILALSDYNHPGIVPRCLATLRGYSRYTWICVLLHNYPNTSTVGYPINYNIMLLILLWEFDIRFSVSWMFWMTSRS